MFRACLSRWSTPIRCSPRWLAVPAAVAAAALTPADAHASALSIQPRPGGDTVVYVSTAALANTVSVSRDTDGRYLVNDEDEDIVPGAGCELIDDDRHGGCLGPDVRAIDMTTGPGDDELTIDDSAYPSLPTLLGAPPLVAHGGEGADTMVGAAGPDTLDGGPGNDPTIAGQGGNDTLLGGDGNDAMDAGPGDDHTVFGDAGNDSIVGGPGNDLRLMGGEGTDAVNGQDGNDDVRGNDGDDTILGGPGDDRLDIGDDPLDDPTGGVDMLDGGPGFDVLGAGSRRSSPAGATTGDSFVGGPDVDTAEFGLRTGSLTIDLDDVADDGEAGERDNVHADVENVVAGSNDDEITGSAAANGLDGRAGGDTVDGNGGDDVLLGGVNDPSADTLVGGTGDDVMRGGSGDDSLTGNDGVDQAFGEGGNDTVETGDGDDVAKGGAGPDRLEGGAGSDVLDGGDLALPGADGIDTIEGGTGDDSLFGRRGNDRLDGGGGADTISGGTEIDIVSYEDRTSRVFVTLDNQANDGERGERDNVMPDVEDVVGGVRADDLTGDGDRNRVEAGRGEDLIDGKLGVDDLDGGDAGDVVIARDGVRDDVVCGDGNDLAIADARDKAIDCETVDRPAGRRLIAGRYALLQPRSAFTLRLPGGRRYFPLDRNTKMRIGSTVDPGTAVMNLATAADRAGTRQTALVSLGRFTVRQTSGARPETELRLAGPRPACGAGRRATGDPGLPRRLRVSVRKRKKRERPPLYAVSGEYSRGATRGTDWLTEDRCDGTLTRVFRGAVRVSDFRRGRTVLVRAGSSYLARPR